MPRIDLLNTLKSTLTTVLAPVPVTDSRVIALQAEDLAAGAVSIELGNEVLTDTTKGSRTRDLLINVAVFTLGLDTREALIESIEAALEPLTAGTDGYVLESIASETDASSGQLVFAVSMVYAVSYFSS